MRGAAGRPAVPRTGRVTEFKKGDKLLFGKQSSTEGKVDGEELVVMREEDVMAVVEAS